MVEPKQTVEGIPTPEGMLVLEYPSIYVEIEAKCNAEVQWEMLETMWSLKVDVDNIKEYNAKLMIARSEQE